MITTSIKQASKLADNFPELSIALKSLSSLVTRPFEPGIVPLSDDGQVKASFERAAMRSRDKAMLETHRRYIDIHIPLTDDESIGWAPLDSLTKPFEPYDNDRDIQFFTDSAHTIVRVRPGDIAIFFPDDAHGPNIGVGFHKKICIKIPVGYKTEDKITPSPVTA